MSRYMCWRNHPHKYRYLAPFAPAGIHPQVPNLASRAAAIVSINLTRENNDESDHFESIGTAPNRLGSSTKSVCHLPR